jgi:hypothetical protein
MLLAYIKIMRTCEVRSASEPNGNNRITPCNTYCRVRDRGNDFLPLLSRLPQRSCKLYVLWVRKLHNHDRPLFQTESVRVYWGPSDRRKPQTASWLLCCSVSFFDNTYCGVRDKTNDYAISYPLIKIAPVGSYAIWCSAMNEVALYLLSHEWETTKTSAPKNSLPRYLDFPGGELEVICLISSEMNIA